MSLKFNLRSHFDLIAELTQNFTDELQKQELHYCRYFALPPVKSTEENTVPQHIPSIQYKGIDALKKGIDSFHDYFRDDEISGRVLQRHPGIMVVNGDEKHSLVGHIEQLNKAKEEFKKLVLTIENSDARFEAVHAAIPGLVTLALYRKIHFETQVPYSLRFTWMHKHATKMLTREQAMEMLDGSARYNNPRMIDQASWLALVQREKARIASLKSGEKLRIRRPTRVSPQVNVRFSATHRYHVSAALPFILFTREPNIKFGDLPDYHKPVDDPRKKVSSYLVERLYLEKTK